MVDEKLDKNEAQEQESHEQTQDEDVSLQQKVDELTELVKRKQAEFENYQKRVEKLQDDLRVFASEKILLKLLPIYDNFALAMQHTENKDECIAGVRMIHTQLKDLLSHEGVTEIQLEDKEFDSRFAQAIQIVNDASKPDGVVVKQLSPAYTFHDKVIQHGKVIVNKIQSEEKQNE